MNIYINEFSYIKAHMVLTAKDEDTMKKESIRIHYSFLSHLTAGPTAAVMRSRYCVL